MYRFFTMEDKLSTEKFCGHDYIVQYPLFVDVWRMLLAVPPELRL